MTRQKSAKRLTYSCSAQVLLIWEIGQICQNLALTEIYDEKVLDLALPKILLCCNSGNSRVSEMALQLFRGLGNIEPEAEAGEPDSSSDDSDEDDCESAQGGIATLLHRIRPPASRTRFLLQILSSLAPRSLRGVSETSAAKWNPTCKKFLAIVLGGVIKLGDEKMFLAEVEAIYADSSRNNDDDVGGGGGDELALMYSSSSSEDEKEEEQEKHDENSIDPSLLSVRGAMRNFRAGGGGAVVTGVAPWAVNNNNNSNSNSNYNQKISTTEFRKKMGMPPPQPKKKAKIVEEIEETKEEEEEEEEEPGLSKLKNFVDALLPIHLRLRLRCSSSKIKIQSKNSNSSRTTTVPQPPKSIINNTLKFHDVVFGQDLGKGTFSTVKFAKGIVRTEPRSSWPNYAVKVIDSNLIKLNNYDASWCREVAALSMLSSSDSVSENVVRLVTHFRFRDKGVFIVIEHCDCGDLFSLVRGTAKKRKRGNNNNSNNNNNNNNSKKTSWEKKMIGFDDSLSLKKTSQGFNLRVIINSVISALSHIHNRGLVFGDLKPENCMICSPGNVLKLCDLGGVRGNGREGERELNKFVEEVKHVRDGDWRINKKEEKKEEKEEKEMEDEEEEENEDFRIESTVAYLPPEMTPKSGSAEVEQTVPTVQSDIWALGCTLFFCCAARVPQLDSDATKTKTKTWEICSEGAMRVAFAGDDGDLMGEATEHPFFTSPSSSLQSFASPSTVQIIETLCAVNVRDRPKSISALRNSPAAGWLNECGKLERGLDDIIVKKAAKNNSSSSSSSSSNNNSNDDDDEWSRRQHSKIWAPQPLSATTANNNNNLNSNTIGDKLRRNLLDSWKVSEAGFVEGGERGGTFADSDDNEKRDVKHSKLLPFLRKPPQPLVDDEFKFSEVEIEVGGIEEESEEEDELCKSNSEN